MARKRAPKSMFLDAEPGSESQRPQAAGRVKKLRPGRSAKSTSGRWWEEATEVPRAALPDAKKLSRRARWYRICIRVSLVLTPFLMLTTMVFLANSLGEDGEASVETSDAYAHSRANAVVEVRRWLATDPSPLPGGVVIGWDSATTTPVPGDDRVAGYDVEVHQLTVASASGALYETTVVLAVSEALGAVRLAEPTLIPVAPSASSHAGDAWPGMRRAQLNDPVRAAVSSWAAAYSSGDPDALRLAIHDTDAGRSYMPLTSAEISDPQFGEVVGRWPEGEERVGDPPTVIVRVSFAITWEGVDVSESRSAARVSYDLLVHQANTAAPVVVAWGGPGTGPTLEAYGNAVGRELDISGRGAFVGEDEALRDEGSNEEGQTDGED